MDRKPLDKYKKIKIVLTDVDGVLTDGGMYYTKYGDSMKRFHTRDGMGVNLLLKNGIKTIIVTKEKTKFVQHWAKKMKVEKLFDSIDRKEKVLERICMQFNVKLNELAFIGDDVNDIEIMKRVGITFVPNDAVKEVKVLAHYVCKLNGGEGVLREVSDLILDKKLGKKKKLY